MADRTATTRADAIEGFAAVLCELRTSAGKPSFREMSGRSRAISHTTLHDAVQGHRLPSWPTTAEFVKACGGDPADYRERWERANRAVQTPQPSEPESEAEPEAEPEPVTELLPEPGTRRAWPRSRRSLIVAAVTAAVLVGAIATTANLLARSGGTPAPTIAPESSMLTPKDCPVHRPNPPAAPPAHAGDAAVFIRDMTLPDCTHVSQGETVTKVWRLKNVGSIPWVGYSLHRIDLPEQRGQCQTITDIPVPTTEPGDMVDVRTQITAPDKPGFCFVRFKLVDANGRVAFPGNRPVNFQLIVD